MRDAGNSGVEGEEESPCEADQVLVETLAKKFQTDQIVHSLREKPKRREKRKQVRKKFGITDSFHDIRPSRCSRH